MNAESACPRPSLYGILIPGKRGRLLATLFTAGGSGLHPVVLLLHGIPGNEKNQDLAHMLCGAGFHVMTFHYSGSWGSDGDYSLAHNIEDTNTVLDYLLADTEHSIDPSRIYLAGHSLGGFVCAQVAARRPEIRAAALLFPCDAGNAAQLEAQSPENAAIIREVFAESAQWLAGTSGPALYAEALAHGSEYRFAALAGALAQKPVLAVTGSFDIYTPAPLHTDGLVRLLQQKGGFVRTVRLETDHFACDRRAELGQALIAFLKELEG